jgi:hypothetical protein
LGSIFVFVFTGNFVAIGTMEPYINIWDLDVIDCLEPAATLGKKKKRSKKVKLFKAVVILSKSAGWYI